MRTAEATVPRALTLAGRRPAGPVQPVPLPKQPERGTLSASRWRHRRRAGRWRWHAQIDASARRRLSISLAAAREASCRTWPAASAAGEMPTTREPRGSSRGFVPYLAGGFSRWRDADDPGASRRFARLRAVPGRRLQPLERCRRPGSLAAVREASCRTGRAASAGREMPTTREPRGGSRGFVPYLAGGFGRWSGFSCRRSRSLARFARLPVVVAVASSRPVVTTAGSSPSRHTIDPHPPVSRR